MMTDLEAYELLLKYCGGEKGLVMIKEMIHVAGVEKAIGNMIIVLREHHPDVSKEFEDWVKQSFEYLKKEMIKPLN